MAWRSKKQSVVSLSRVEAENRALRHATTELSAKNSFRRAWIWS